MPIRSSFAVALALAGAIACGAAIQAHAASPDNGYLVETQGRDLKPVPGNAGRQHRPTVTLRPSAPVVPVGAPVTFEISSSVNGYGHLYVISASGRTQVWMENVPVAAGRRIVFPAGSLGIKAAPPTGREDLMLIVSKERINGFFGYASTRTPRVVDRDPQSFKQALTATFIDMPHRQWGYARTSVRVVDRSLPGPGWSWGSAQARPDDWADQWDMD